MAESARTSTARAIRTAPVISLPSLEGSDVHSVHYGPEAAHGRTAPTRTDQRPLGSSVRFQGGPELPVLFRLHLLLEVPTSVDQPVRGRRPGRSVMEMPTIRLGMGLQELGRRQSDAKPEQPSPIPDAALLRLATCGMLEAPLALRIRSPRRVRPTRPPAAESQARRPPAHSGHGERSGRTRAPRRSPWCYGPA